MSGSLEKTLGTIRGLSIPHTCSLMYGHGQQQSGAPLGTKNSKPHHKHTQPIKQTSGTPLGPESLRNREEVSESRF